MIDCANFACYYYWHAGIDTEREFPSWDLHSKEKCFTSIQPNSVSIPGMASKANRQVLGNMRVNLHTKTNNWLACEI